MTLKQWMQILFVSGCIVLVAAACHSRKYSQQNPMAVSEANAAYTGPGVPHEMMAQSNGLGEEAPFGEQAVHKTKKVAGNNKHRVYYFDFDSSIIKEQDKPGIAANAEYLLGRPKSKILLEGHTDPRGSREYNIGLGERRAKAVAEVLAAKGVAPSQIRIVSYGAEKLASNGRTESDYQLDRRGVLVYLQH